MNYSIKENVLTISKSDITLSLVILKEDLFHFFEKKKKSHTITKTRRAKHINIDDLGNKIKIFTSLYDIYIEDDFSISIYDGKTKEIVVKDNKYVDTKEKVISNEQKLLLEKEGHSFSNTLTYSYIINKEIQKNEAFYGLGEKTGYFNKINYQYVNWNTDDPSAHVDNYEALYQSCPFYIGKHKHTYGLFFDDTFKTIFDMGTDLKNIRIKGTLGSLDYYFIGGKNITDVRKKFVDLVGVQTMPSKFMLGNMQSRWSYMNKDEVLNVVNKYEESDIPLDVIFLDIDYMDNFKVFTYNNETFNDLPSFIKLLNSKGVRVVPIIDPGVKVEKDYFMYEEGMKNGYFAKDGKTTYVGEVWPGDSVFPAFTNKEVRLWWGKHVKDLMDLGISGIWNDMNEPSSFKGPLPDSLTFKGDNGKTLGNLEAHNIYAHYMSKATFDAILEHTNKRPFVITRAAYAGTQKYSTTWTGDNQSIWEHLRLAVPELLNMGLSGQSLVATDIGGFGGHTNKELLIRWAEFGALSPICRNHSAAGTRSQEPYTFDDETTSIYRKHMKLRYSLLPYMYDCFYNEQFDKVPPMRPLLLKYPNDVETFNINYEYMFGPNLLVAPVLNEGETKKMVYFPDTFYDYYTKEKYTKGYKVVDAPLDKLPLFVLKNSIIPTYKSSNHIKESYDTISLEVFGNLGSYTTMYDDGETLDLSKNDLINFHVKNNVFSVTYKRYSSDTHYKKVNLLYREKAYEFELDGTNQTFTL